MRERLRGLVEVWTGAESLRSVVIWKNTRKRMRATEFREQYMQNLVRQYPFSEIRKQRNQIPKDKSLILIKHDFLFTLQNIPIFCWAQNLKLIGINSHLKLLVEFYSGSRDEIAIQLPWKIQLPCKRDALFTLWGQPFINASEVISNFFSKYLIKSEMCWTV